jgi:glycerol-3-phosphate dehydrogenase
LGPSEFLSVEETMSAAPTLDREGLRGGIRYHDGQFDDARMAIHLAMTAADHGATLINYCEVQDFLKSDGMICGVRVKDHINGVTYDAKAKVVINATGVFTDAITQMDHAKSPHLVSPSQGIHIVLDKEFLPADTAIMIPRTDDGRVLFAVPWHQKIIVGTTDTTVDHPSIEPIPLNAEIDFVLLHIGHYLSKNPVLEDIRSIFCGLRPLVSESGKSSASLSREHHISISNSELISIVGGKWTTYRKMAEDVVNVAIQKASLPDIPCKTNDLPVHGFDSDVVFDSPLYYYGSDRQRILEIMETHHEWREQIHSDFPISKAEIIWAVREEMCMTIEDFLARRCRLLFLDAAAALQVAPLVADIMAHELSTDEAWKRKQIDAFTSLAKNYLPIHFTDQT